MLYVERDEAGNIVSLHNKPETGADEQKTVMDEEVIKFLEKNIGTDPRIQLLSLSDTGIIRILEDLIDLLIRKNIILFTELPECLKKHRQRSVIAKCCARESGRIT
jgi:hypothetical protein